MAVSEEARAAVWNGLLDTARYHRYFDVLARRYGKREKLHRFVLAALGAGALGILAQFIPEDAIAVVGAGIIAFTIWDLVDNPTRKAALANLARSRIVEFEAAQRSLWERMQQGEIDDVEALGTHHAVQRELQLALRDIDLATDEKTNIDSAKDVYEAEARRYGQE